MSDPIEQLEKLLAVVEQQNKMMAATLESHGRILVHIDDINKQQLKAFKMLDTRISQLERITTNELLQ